jgi:tRNA(adenine34) deaminase
MTHEDYMKEALYLAQEAGAAGDVPVGCVIVRNGEIVARGRNRREEDHNALAHAELEAIKQACAVLGGWRLSGCRLYVTLEPCPMCAGGIISARIPEVYYGAKDSGIGACGSVLNLFEEGFRHRPKLVGGILEEECKGELTKFFQNLRNNS